MRYVNLNEVLELHERILAQSGGSTGLRQVGGLESTNEQEAIILQVASGQLDRKAFTAWLHESISERK